MDLLKDPEMIKLVALLSAFVIGVVVCVYVVIRETVDLKRRRKAKELMYKEEVRREVRRKQNQMRQVEQSSMESMA